MGLFKTARFASANHTKNRTQDSASTTFRKNISSAAIATLKSDVESNFSGIGFNFTGLEFDYKVVLEGSTVPYQKALNFLFPKGRDDIITNPFETLP